MGARNTKGGKVKGQARAWGYARVSTADQAEHGVSLEAQTAKIHQWCTANGYELVDLLVDAGLSGGRSDRPALQAALKAVGRGDVLVVHSISRLARSTKDTLAIGDDLKKRGVGLVSLTEKEIDTTSPQGRVVFQMLAVIAEFEKNIIGERTRVGMAQLRSQGKFTGGHPPYGWAQEGAHLALVPAEQEVLGLVAGMKAAGQSIRTISRALAARGIMNRVGRPFAPTQVQRMVRAPIRLGAA